MVKVKDLLDQKQGNLWSIHPKASILDALKIMSRRDVGALPVVDEMGLVGIVSERDFVHVIARLEQCEIERKIDRYMNKDVVTVTPDTTLEECMTIMAEKKVRHLPVLDDKEMIGLISYGDVIRALVARAEGEKQNQN
ncbi:MAG: CBS domain-containing protein [Anaerolineaceae bacterium]|jgi:CBS domain-containing protein|nr:CBS domain-containing protein [Anaerolineaceae bacterium]